MERRLVHQTQVKVDLVELRKLVSQLKVESDSLGGKPQSRGAGTPEQRSKFHSYNTLSKFLSRIDNGLDYSILDLQGQITDTCQRIYYNPSLTSYTRLFRKCIVPLNAGNVFVYFDLSAAEFFMNCWFCGEQEAVDAYLRGEDIYMHYAYIFPKGLSRSVIKTCLISYMYDATKYSVAKRCGISESKAQYLLNLIDYNLPNMALHKTFVKNLAQANGHYVCPNGFDQSLFIKASEYKPTRNSKEPEFCPELALSVYVQSALGVFMQQLITRLSKRDTTVLSVFDSVLLEISPDRIDSAREWFSKNLYPFRMSDFKAGTDFYSVYAE